MSLFQRHYMRGIDIQEILQTTIEQLEELSTRWSELQQ